MTTSLRSKIGAEIGWTWRDHVDTAPVIDSNRLRFSQDLADGSGANQANGVWHAEDQTLSAGGSTSFDLDALDKSLFGDTVTVSFEKVKAILIVNNGTSGYLLVGGAATDEWYAPFGAAGDTVKVMPESPLLLANAADGWDVTPEAAVLKIAAVGADGTFDIAILGTTPDAGSSSSSSGS